MESSLNLKAKLLKLVIRNSSGIHIDWIRFWNQFEAEIDKSNLPSISKFSLKVDVGTKSTLTGRRIALQHRWLYISKEHPNVKIWQDYRSCKRSRSSNYDFPNCSS